MCLIPIIVAKFQINSVIIFEVIKKSLLEGLNRSLMGWKNYVKGDQHRLLECISVEAGSVIGISASDDHPFDSFNSNFGTTVAVGKSC